MKKNILIFLVIFFIASCTKEATIRLPKQEPMLVVTSFICPEDTVISVYVRLSQPKFSNSIFFTTPYEVEDANVTLSDGNTQVPLPHAQNSYGKYEIKSSLLPIQNGKTYYLTVSTPDGKSVNAQTTIPEETLKLKDLNISINSSNRQYSGSLSVNDIADTKNYVALYAFNAWSSKQTALSPFFDTLYDRVNPVFDTDENISKTNYVFSLYDELGNGGSDTPNDNDTITYVEAFFSVMNCSKEFYLYDKSIRKASASNENPFSDPVLIYTNINNGLGCFGGFNQTKFSKKLL